MSGHMVTNCTHTVGQGHNYCSPSPFYLLYGNAPHQIDFSFPTVY
ncbi:rCG32753, partial [Rattus norvegicus]